MSKARLLFLGTPKFAACILEALINSDEYEIPAVITQPDKPAGRGNKLKSPEVKDLADKHSIAVFQPASLKKFAEELKQFGQIDAIICVAYGKIIPKSVLDFPEIAPINIHPSLLPRWRGAAPIQCALFSGDQETGVCLMQMDEGLDSGPIYCCEKVSIKDNEDFPSLENRLAEISARLLIEKLPEILSGKLEAKSQSLEGLRYAEKWDKEDYQLNFEEDAATCLRRIRTCAPDGARCKYRNEIVKIHKAKTANIRNNHLEPGSVVLTNKEEFILACGDGNCIAIEEMQFAGKKKLKTREILSGKKFDIGEKFC